MKKHGKKREKEKVKEELYSYVNDRFDRLSYDMEMNDIFLKDLYALQYAIMAMGDYEFLMDDDRWDSEELKYECRIVLERIKENWTVKDVIQQLQDIRADDKEYMEADGEPQNDSNPFYRGISALTAVLLILKKKKAV